MQSRIVGIVALAASLIFSACGDDEGAGAPATDPPTTRAAVTTAAPATTATTTTAAPTTTTTIPTTTTTTTQPPETTTTALPGGFEVTLTTEIIFQQTADSVWEIAVFRAEGAAVDAGVICAEGALELFGYDSDLGTWRREVQSVCGDGSGWFLLELDLRGVQRDDGYGEEGTWFIRTGTGDYTTLAGVGIDVTTQPENSYYVSLQEGLVAAG